MAPGLTMRCEECGMVARDRYCPDCADRRRRLGKDDRIRSAVPASIVQQPRVQHMPVPVGAEEYAFQIDGEDPEVQLFYDATDTKLKPNYSDFKRQKEAARGVPLTDATPIGG